MQCEKCGNQNPPGARYCGYCQHELNQKKGCILFKGYVVLIVLCAALCVIIGVFIQKDKLPARATEPEETVHIHTWTDATCTSYATCTGCGMTNGLKLAHKWTEGTCLEPGVCKICGTVSALPAHQWGNGTPKVCRICGKPFLTNAEQNDEIKTVQAKKNQLREDGISFVVDRLKRETGRADIKLRSITFRDTVKEIPSECVIDVSAGQDCSVLAWLKAEEDLYIAAEGEIIAPEDCAELFSGMAWLEEIQFNDCFDTSDVTCMRSMFEYCTYLKALDLSCFDTTKVTDMGQMFWRCMALQKIDVSSFDTSSVEKMNSMFAGCDMKKLDVSNFDTSNVTDMAAMFEGCDRLISLDLSNFDVSKDPEMICMLRYCENLKEVNLSSFNVTDVEIAERLFYGCDLPEKVITRVRRSDEPEMYSESLDGFWNNVLVSVGGVDTRSWILYEPVKDCCSIEMHYRITSVDYGKIAGTYGLYRKTLNDNWERIGTFKVTDRSEIVKTFEFEKPISFTELAVAAPSGRMLSFNSNLWFEDCLCVKD